MAILFKAWFVPLIIFGLSFVVLLRIPGCEFCTGLARLYIAVVVLAAALLLFNYEAARHLDTIYLPLIMVNYVVLIGLLLVLFVPSIGAEVLRIGERFSW